MSDMTVWAFRPIAQLNGQTGFVQCDEALAKELIASGDVQSLDVGGLYLKDIQAGEYMTKDMQPKRRGRPHSNVEAE